MDPAHRLGAATLEQRWKSALEQVDGVKQAYATHPHAQGAQDLVSHRDAVLALGHDLPRLWHAPTMSAKDRKRMLRLVIKDLTITKAAKNVTVQIRWHGGATEELLVPLRPAASEQWRHDPALVEQVRELAQPSTEEQIGEHLHQAGVKTQKGHRLTVAAIRWIRFTHAIPVPTLKRAEERTVTEIAAHFGVSPPVGYYWIKRQHLAGRNLATPKGVAWFLTLEQETEHRLRLWVEQSARITKQPVSQNPIVGGAL